MTSKVYLIKSKENLNQLAQKVPFKDKAAIKTHFGEKDNITFPDPKIIKFFSDKIKRPTLIECNVLYRSPRTRASTHIKLAKEHGFDFAPIDILDGEMGDKDLGIEVNLKHFDKIYLGQNYKNYQNILFISHFKGHILTGFGGTLKNIGMGLGSRRGKLAMHSNIAPTISQTKCISCNKCVEQCPVDAISMENKASIDKNKCIGCAKCISVCPENAISIPWGSVSSKDAQERIVEYCYGALKDKNTYFINLLVDITEKCDCAGEKMKPLLEDIGYLSSKDPVALDQACLDLVKKKEGKDIFKELNADPEPQLGYAEKIGLGSRDYELVKLD